jgi:hypothetical protein
MPDPNKTHVCFILDRSGSMSACRDATIEGFNSFLARQQQAGRPGDTADLFQFDDQLEAVDKDAPLAAAPLLTRETFVPRGWTRLLDAVGGAIDGLGSRLAGLPEEHRPGKVLVVVLTDGNENDSRRYYRHQVFRMIKHQQEKYAWTFAYIGASADAFTEAGSLGIAKGNTMQYAATPIGTQQAFARTADSAAAYRSATPSGVSSENFFGNDPSSPNLQGSNP